LGTKNIEKEKIHIEILPDSPKLTKKESHITLPPPELIFSKITENLKNEGVKNIPSKKSSNAFLENNGLSSLNNLNPFLNSKTEPVLKPSTSSLRFGEFNPLPNPENENNNLLGQRVQTTFVNFFDNSSSYNFFTSLSPGYYIYDPFSR